MLNKCSSNSKIAYPDLKLCLHLAISLTPIGTHLLKKDLTGHSKSSFGSMVHCMHTSVAKYTFVFQTPIISPLIYKQYLSGRCRVQIIFDLKQF